MKKKEPSKSDHKEYIDPDPYGVTLKPKYGTRKCSSCGKLIEIGRYKCPCQKWVASGDNLLEYSMPKSQGKK